jgi:hypothetical protein
MTWPGCVTCGRVGEHAPWCERVSAMLRERDAGGERQPSWPDWLADSPTQHLDNWGTDATHCPNGHELTPTTLYVSPRGQRRCRQCFNLYQRGYYRKRRKARKELAAKL